MNQRAYYDFVENVERKIVKSGVPLYKMAQLIGISDNSLRRFLNKEGLHIYTILMIADYFNISIFARNCEKVD